MPGLRDVDSGPRRFVRGIETAPVGDRVLGFAGRAVDSHLVVVTRVAVVVAGADVGDRAESARALVRACRSLLSHARMLARGPEVMHRQQNLTVRRTERAASLSVHSGRPLDGYDMCVVVKERDTTRARCEAGWSSAQSFQRV